MSTPRFRVLTVAVVVLWGLAGPVGMAFGGCAVMGALCEAPCGLTTPVVMVAPVAVLVLHVVGEVPPVVQARPTGIQRVLEFPPRPFLHSA